MASEADIIATLYFDNMDIYRKEKVKNPNTGITTMQDRKSTRLNSSHPNPSRMPSSA